MHAAGPSAVFLVSRRRRIRESHKYSPTWPSGSGMAPRLAVSRTDMSPCLTPSSPHPCPRPEAGPTVGREDGLLVGSWLSPARRQPDDVSPVRDPSCRGPLAPSPIFAVQPPGCLLPVLRLGRDQARQDRHAPFTPNAPQALQHAWVISIWGQRLTCLAYLGDCPVSAFVHGVAPVSFTHCYPGPVDRPHQCHAPGQAGSFTASGATLLLPSWYTASIRCPFKARAGEKRKVPTERPHAKALRGARNYSSLRNSSRVSCL